MITRTNSIACFNDLIASVPEEKRVRIAWHFTGDENQEIFPKKDDNSPILDNIDVKSIQLLAYSVDELILCEQDLDVLAPEIRDLLSKVFKTPKYAFVPSGNIVYSNGIINLNC